MGWEMWEVRSGAKVQWAVLVGTGLLLPLSQDLFVVEVSCRCWHGSPRNGADNSKSGVRIVKLAAMCAFFEQDEFSMPGLPSCTEE